jgi:hypothetical protein
VRRIAVRAPAELSGRLERMAARARRRGLSLEVGTPEEAPAPGLEVFRLATLPLAGAAPPRLAAFPVRLGRAGFSFDGRSYAGPGDALLLCDPSRPRETLVLGNSADAVVRLASRRLLWEESPSCGYRLVSGDLVKEGRFLPSGPGLAIDRNADRDGIAQRETFLRSLATRKRDRVVWRFPQTERAAVEKWDAVLRRHAPESRERAPITLYVFPDPATKGRFTGSSRPADLSEEGEGFRVDLDASAADPPDLVSPILASAALASEEPALFGRATLAAAAGARACGRWWGRDIASFAAFVHRAGVEPTIAEVLTSDPEVSPVLSIGAAASWLEAGARAEGEAAVRRALRGDSARLREALGRWRSAAIRVRPRPPDPRPLPDGFLRGVSYAMTNAIDGSYASPRSRRTLERLAAMSVNAISVMPYAFSPEPARPQIAFVHRSPRGETDEGTVRAITDARTLGMSALVKPQIWLPGGAFVGSVAMRTEEQWRSWFAGYRRFVVHHAVVAEAAGAALFCVGTELVATEHRMRQWRETIAAVRLATGAPLLYASNWAAGAERVGFWDHLDAIGVDFYDPLSEDPAASDRLLEAGVRRVSAPLARLARRTGKAVVFAEAGYPPVRGAWTAPHDEETERPREPRDAARAVAAVFRALEGTGWWKGVYWWKVFSGGEEAGPGERGFNLIGTPAEKAIAAAYARAAAAGTGR